MIKFIQKLKKISYVLICFIYRKITSFYFKTKYKDIKKINSLRNSYIKYQKNVTTSELVDIKKISKTLKSDYQEILIIEKDYINEIINNIFDIKFRKFILKKTNLNYSIDYILFYENKYINKKFRSKSIYANQMHIDKPFSPFTIKLFIPINIMSDKYGPLEVKISNSNSYSTSCYNPMDFVKFYSIKDSTNIYIFNPSENYHRACIPEENYCSRNLLLQLNPSKEWSKCKNLYLKQFNIEPNFPEIRNLNIVRELI